MARLKVFCATSGFHESVVAAPSRPAALKAWGARTDLFSMGVARQVTDPKIVKQALARPGQVIRLGRSGEIQTTEGKERTAKKKPKAKPPSRAKLTSAEKRLKELDAKQAAERRAIERQLSDLSRRREQLGKRLAKARHAAEQRLTEAKESYEAALKDWDG